jgi:hypothetical protein
MIVSLACFVANFQYYFVAGTLPKSRIAISLQLDLRIPHFERYLFRWQPPLGAAFSAQQNAVQFTIALRGGSEYVYRIRLFYCFSGKSK